MPISALLSSITLGDLDSALSNNPAFRSVFHGYMAEEKLRCILESNKDVSSVEKIPDHSSCRGDYRVIYKDRLIIVESKSLCMDVKTSTSSSWKGTCRNISRLNGRNFAYSNTDYDMLAVSLFPATKRWDFAYFTKADLKLLSKTFDNFPQKITITNNHFSTKRTLDEVLCSLIL